MLSQDELDRFATSLRSGDYNVLLGAAASLGSTNGDGVELPLGNGLKDELCDLKGAKRTNSLQRVYQLLNEEEVTSHITNRFSGCKPGPALRSLTSFIWKRIFTLNIDDALEAAYSTGEPYQRPIVRNYRDHYEEVRSSAEVPLIHLHGFTQRPSDGYVFSRDAYLNIIKSSNPWATVLAQTMAVEPFIIMGSSLDEVDLDYFLSLRSQATARSDRGPSFLIEPYGDVVTQHECERLGLTLFPGTAEEFMQFINREVLKRPRPHELVPRNDRALFPDDISTVEISQFFSDFERVPVADEVNTNDPRFFFGHPPTWSDLTLQYDVARDGTYPIAKRVADTFNGSEDVKLFLLADDTGVGKTTTLRRIGFDFARQGVTVLSCFSNSLLEPRTTAVMLNRIAGRCVVIIDNLAEQVYSLEGIFTELKKQDIVFLTSERAYRRRFIVEALSGIAVRTVKLTDLTRTETDALIDTYISAGLVGDEKAISHRSEAVSSLQNDPIAIACCRLMNNLRPLDRIVDSLLKEAITFERRRYLTAALAQYCSPSGVRYDLLSLVGGGAGINSQFSSSHVLPLGFSEERARNYIVPLNGTLGSRVLEICLEHNPEEIFDIYVSLAKALAARVSKRTIRQRTPEAKLAGRLFDFDQVVQKFVRGRSHDFFEAVHDEWQWNSRYWEQIALLHLGEAQKVGLSSRLAVSSLSLAMQHARHAVAIERHPLTLTTLAKVILASISTEKTYSDALFSEAVENLTSAIAIEKGRRRIGVQPYVVMFRGYLKLSAKSNVPHELIGVIKAYAEDAARIFKRDAEVLDVISQLRNRIG